MRHNETATMDINDILSTLMDEYGLGIDDVTFIVDKIENFVPGKSNDVILTVGICKVCKSVSDDNFFSLLYPKKSNGHKTVEICKSCLGTMMDNFGDGLTGDDD